MKGQQRLLYLLPACILVFAFFLFPLAYLSYISFFEWDGLGPKTFVGFENFEYVIGHYHDNQIIDEKYVLLYEQMVRVL